MGRLRFDISMSLDGFVAGPNDGAGNGLGDGGERLHEWVYGLESWRTPHGYEGGETGEESDVLGEAFDALGAIVMGRRMFDLAEGAWGDDPPFHMPVFVLTHRARDPIVKQGGTTFTFVTDGIESALEQAREAAGDKDVGVAGGTSVAQQYLEAGLLDELQIHLVPILLGGGVRLFDQLGDTQIELETTRVIDSPQVTHLRFQVLRQEES
jgi:dihydrofolate reductase